MDWVVNTRVCWGRSWWYLRRINFDVACEWVWGKPTVELLSSRFLVGECITRGEHDALKLRWTTYGRFEVRGMTGIGKKVRICLIFLGREYIKYGVGTYYEIWETRRWVKKWWCTSSRNDATNDALTEMQSIWGRCIACFHNDATGCSRVSAVRSLYATDRKWCGDTIVTVRVRLLEVGSVFWNHGFSCTCCSVLQHEGILSEVRCTQ